ncbi:MAG: hypothetical protein ACKOQM_02170 [Novosphingobium sp.]
MNDNEALAKQRFFMLGMIRLASTALLVVGLLIVAGKIDIPKPAGAAFAIFGLLELVFLPRFLASKWKTPDA